MKSLPKSGHHAVMCAFYRVLVPTKTTLLGVEENGVLVVREVVQICSWRVPCEGSAGAKIPAYGIVRFGTSEVDESACASVSVQETGSQVRGWHSSRCGSLPFVDWKPNLGA